MVFESENTIRIINKSGIDTVLELDFSAKALEENRSVKVKSVCKIDLFDEVSC